MKNRDKIQDAIPNDLLSQFSTRLDALEKRPRPGFGDWETRDVEDVYQAESDGFLAAYTGGRGVDKTICLETEASEAAIRIQNPNGNCNTTGLRTRAGAFDGSVTPVKQGHFYTVRIRQGVRGSVTVYWLPLQK